MKLSDLNDDAREILTLMAHKLPPYSSMVHWTREDISIFFPNRSAGYIWIMFRSLEEAGCIRKLYHDMDHWQRYYVTEFGIGYLNSLTTLECLNSKCP